MLRVSALMPVRHDEAHVGAAIHSLVRQTISDFELIVIEDGSTDRTCDIVREWAARDARVKLVRLSRRLGLAASLNFGMGMCRAPLVAYCPADAVSDSRRFERQTAWLAERPFTALVGGGAQVVDDTGALAETLRPAGRYQQIRAALLKGETLVTASMMWRRREIEAIGMLATDVDLAGAELYELAVRVAARHPIENLAESLCVIPRTVPTPASAAAREPALRRVRALAGELLAGVAAIGAPETMPLPVAVARPPQTRHRPRGRIFVVIACYRDRELAPTITDLFARASYPDDISVGVCLQYDPAVDDPRCANVPTRPDQVQIVHAHRGESLGLGWARYVSERLWRGEHYVLQIDAHMRFADGWDERLIDQEATW